MMTKLENLINIELKIIQTRIQEANFFDNLDKRHKLTHGLQQ